MQFQGALISERGVAFGIVVVKPSLLNSADRDDVQSEFSQFFGTPVVLMAQNSRGIPKYYGRPDIVRFLSNVHPARIPWKRYTLQ